MSRSKIQHTNNYNCYYVLYFNAVHFSFMDFFIYEEKKEYYLLVKVKFR